MSTSDSSSNSSKTLPKNRAILESMFKHCDICIERARNAIHRSAQKIRYLWDYADGKISWEELRRRTQQIDEVHQRVRDSAITEIEALWPFCEIELLAAAGDHMEHGGLAIAGIEVRDQQGANKLAKSSAELLMGQRLHVTALQRLRHRIFESLEAKGGADAGADIEAFLAKIAPRNADVADLHVKLIRLAGSGKTQNEIALDFADGKRDRAASLLRGVRRYRERLKEWNK